jgi:tRNA nucleotidyltransferase (CCA-adding enzyme)
MKKKKKKTKRSDFMKQKLEQILMEPKKITVEYLEKNKEAIFSIVPELKDEDGFDQKSSWHIYDVWKHTEVALSNSNQDLDERIALLLHDIGKPHSYTEDGEVRHFGKHAEKSAEIAKPILERLGYSTEKRELICELIKRHSTLINPKEVNGRNLEKMKKLLNIQYCDTKAYNPEKIETAIKRLDSIKAEITAIEKSISKTEER